MRTTLTLDDDVSARLEREQKARKIPFKQLVNDMLRAGLDAAAAPRPLKAPVRIEPLSLGPSLIGSLDDIEGVLSRVEGEDHK